MYSINAIYVSLCLDVYNYVLYCGVKVVGHVEVNY